MSYTDFKNSRMGKAIITVQGYTNPYKVECVNLAWDYAAYLFPNVNFRDSISKSNAKDMYANSSATYFTKIKNDVNSATQVPNIGDIMIFDATPKAGYTNTFNNPYGHVGICDSIVSGGFYLLQENAPADEQPVNSTKYTWKFRPCIGWLRPKEDPAVATKREADRIAAEKAEAERQAQIAAQIEADRQAQAEKARLEAVAEAERVAIAKAEELRIAKEKADAEAQKALDAKIAEAEAKRQADLAEALESIRKQEELDKELVAQRAMEEALAEQKKIEDAKKIKDEQSVSIVNKIISGIIQFILRLLKRKG